MTDDIAVNNLIQEKEIRKSFSLKKLEKLINSTEVLYFISKN